MKRFRAWASSAGLVLLALAGCHSKEKSAAPTNAANPAPPAAQAIAQEATTDQAVARETSTTPAAPSPTEAISSARNLLKTGNVDEAAARLAQLRIQGARFNAQQAKDYRQALSEAYDRAIEAGQRGDPKAQAAIELLRAAAPR